MMNSRVKTYFAIHIFLMIYSTGGIISKFAGRHEFLSLPFILLYGLQIVILAFYAVGWQQFIKRMPLSAAYANKAVGVVWGCIWGVIIFQEHLSVGKVAGCLLVLVGVALYGYADGKSNAASGSVVQAASKDVKSDTGNEGDRRAVDE